jgi:hypothetical protein
MSNAMELEHTHFRQMKRVVANIEKEWKLGALAGVKTELLELSKLSMEIETVIKNQWYHSLSAPEKDHYNGKENSNQGRGTNASSE